ncbi:TRAP-type C4-dicarboxylate transport system, small permease component [Hoeflea phototrophica DFL-43]|uniref:TRAP transporter small permease protein n=1 Tax=Hoeflea phototrophica (strain DSM 17068 / NCIMB 14078 / DFL-43) TaxID=411684 RepID=A9D940_HOEPD|nr:TRAP transporter small permease subunit [Hoeflea phototrophica]EDQ32845.1 TRAP-type C4-dicarboxylate transport system, small permease component [Hoeflea phototrophica DFL-43]
MQQVTRLYNAFLFAMAFISGAMLVWLMVSVVVSVFMRNLGIQPFAWLFTSSEYALLYMTMLGAPWLVRVKGHVHIELVTAGLRPAARRIISRLVAALCVLVCLVLAWKGVELVHTNLARNDYDVRAYYFPRWLLTISFPVCFGLMAVEFSRFVFGRELMHSGEAGIHE